MRIFNLKTRIKMSNSHMGKKRLPFSEETKKKISKANKGKKRTEEHKLKTSENNARYWLGKHRSDETKKKIGDSHRGDKSVNWLGGKSFEPYSVDWTDTFKKSIRERDHYICLLCLSYGNEVHHINYDKKNCNPSNLITLCKKCHAKTNQNRNYWINQLININ